MSYKKRSQEYDWFKGGSNNNKKDPKKGLKTTWKFTRIFLMFSLFFFSMWGCVQTYVFKSDNTVGSGLELYGDEKEISPRLTRLQITSAKSGTQDIYSLSSDGETNHWLNYNADGKEKEALTGLQHQLITDAQDNGPAVHKLSDAFKGMNMAFQLMDGKEFFDGEYVLKNSAKDKWFALSTFTQKTFAPTTAPTNIVINNKLLAIKQPDAGKGVADSRYNFALSLWERLDEILSAKYHLASGKHFLFSQLVKGDFSTTGLTDAQLVDIQNAQTATNKFIARLTGAAIYPAAGTPYVNLNAGLLTAWNTKYRPIVTWKQAWVRGVGPFYGIFVYPVSRLANAITGSMPIMGGFEAVLAIVFIVFILRAFGFMISFKSTLQQTKQQELQAKKAAIDAKYVSYKGNKQMEARQKQEVAELYKKAGISPLGAIGSIFITMPIFLSIWRTVGAIQHLKATVWLGINFSATSWRELFAGHWQYLPLMIIAAGSAAFSQIFPRLLTKRRDKNRINVHQKEAMKKNNKTQNIMMVVFVFISLIFSAGIQIYWIVGGVWTVIQSTITHNYLIWDGKRRKRNKVKLI